MLSLKKDQLHSKSKQNWKIKQKFYKKNNTNLTTHQFYRIKIEVVLWKSSLWNLLTDKNIASHTDKIVHVVLVETKNIKKKFPQETNKTKNSLILNVFFSKYHQKAVQYLALYYLLKKFYAKRNFLNLNQ